MARIDSVVAYIAPGLQARIGPSQPTVKAKRQSQPAEPLGR